VSATTPTTSYGVDNVPRGPNCLRVNSLVSATRKRVSMAFGTAVNGRHYFIRGYLYVATDPSGNNACLHVGNGSSDTNSSRLMLWLTSSRTLILRNAGSTIFTSAALAANTHTRIEVRFKRDATTPNAGADEIELRIDGSSVFSTSTGSISTAASFVAVGGNIQAEAQTQGDWYWSDLAINDDQGTFQNSWPGSGAHAPMRPDGTGTFDEPTPNGAANNWDCVDEAVPDNTTTYANMGTNSASWAAAGSRLLMTLQSAASAGIGASDVIACVAVGVIWSSATAATSQAQPGLRSGGSTIDVGTGRSITTTTDSFIDDSDVNMMYAPQHQDPASADWTPATLDSLEIGCRSTDTSPNARITAVWALVDYLQQAAAPTIDMWLGRAPAQAPIRHEVVGY